MNRESKSSWVKEGRDEEAEGGLEGDDERGGDRANRHLVNLVIGCHFATFDSAVFFSLSFCTGPESFNWS